MKLEIRDRIEIINEYSKIGEVIEKLPLAFFATNCTENEFIQILNNDQQIKNELLLRGYDLKKGLDEIFRLENVNVLADILIKKVNISSERALPISRKMINNLKARKGRMDIEIG